MSAFIMVVFILEAKTEWISYYFSDWKFVEQQQGVIALLLYQAQTVTSLQEKSIETVNPILYLKNALLRWGIFCAEFHLAIKEHLFYNLIIFNTDVC